MPPGLVQDDQIIDAPGLAAEVKALFDDAGIRKRHVVSAVSNRQAITRNIMVPKMSLKELEEAIKWEAERYIPFPIDEVELDFFVLDNPEDVPRAASSRSSSPPPASTC
jgi:type IV pilus assembly protein PilM